MSFDLNTSNIEITCEKCNEPVDARVTGYEADVELGPDADVRTCRTDKFGLNIHVQDPA